MARSPLRGGSVNYDKYNNISNLTPVKKKKFYQEYVVESTPRKSYSEYRNSGPYTKYSGKDEDDFYIPNTGIDQAFLSERPIHTRATTITYEKCGEWKSGKQREELLKQQLKSICKEE